MTSPVSARALKISGVRYWIVDVAAEAHRNVKIARSDLSADGPSPDLCTVVQIDTDASDVAVALYVGNRVAPTGYVVSWDRTVSVWCTDTTTVRILFAEGHKPTGA